MRKAPVGDTVTRTPAPVVKSRRWLKPWLYLFAGTALASQGAAWAADLPQVLQGAGARWSGANLPQLRNNGADMVIRQTTEAATLHWRSFDIGAGNSVTFEQPNASSVALNRIFQNDPSRILGRLTANGQIYLINQNGFVFGEGARVDTNSLVVSTLDIDDAIFENGILSAIANREAAFVGEGEMGAIDIGEGAEINAAEGGRILVLAPDIVNRGTLNTPGGQAILAAAKDKVYLAQSGDTDLRGLLVEIETGGDQDINGDGHAGVTNLGSIIAERGNVSMLGMAVNQSGTVRATSTVSLNGSIRLVAGDNNGNEDNIDIKEEGRRNAVNNANLVSRGGELVVGETSRTEVTLEGDELALDGQSQPNAYVRLLGKQVTVKSGASVVAPGGEVDIVANPSPGFSLPVDPGPQVADADTFVQIETGASIDVSGDESTLVPVSRNIVEVEARGNELADSPLQRDGAIRNSTLFVDIRKDTPFLSIDGSLQNIGRSVGERNSTGGRVRIGSSGEVQIDQGASIDIRGGQVRYSGGAVSTSKLISDDGRLFDISDADPNRRYVGLLGGNLEIRHDKWGITESFRSTLGAFEPGYSEGKDAGSLEINTRRLVFDGELLAGGVAGEFQRFSPVDPIELDLSFLRPFDQRPFGGNLSIGVTPTNGVQSVVIGDFADPDESSRDSSLDPFLVSGEQLRDSGVSRFEVSTTGIIGLGSLSLADSTRLDLTAGKVVIDGEIRSAGGGLTAAAAKSTTSNGITVPDADVAITVSNRTRLDVSGRWSNDSALFNSGRPTGSVVRDGGRVSLDADGDLTLAQGAVVDVSGGGQFTAEGDLMAGKGGAVSLASTDSEKNLPTSLVVDAELRGYAFEAGGRLSLTANRILVADSLAAAARLDASSGSGLIRTGNETDRVGQTLVVDPALFQSGGFASFELAATRGGLEVADGTQVRLLADNRILDAGKLGALLAQRPDLLGSADAQALSVNGDFAGIVPTDTEFDLYTRIDRLPAYLRHPVDLSLKSSNKYAFDITQDFPQLSIGSGVNIQGDPQADVRLQADTLLLVDGVIDAPAGNISLTLDNGFDGYRPEQKIWLGPRAQLNAPGTFVARPDALGLRRGTVLDGGRIEVRADFGSVITDTGSRLNVDGVSQVLDLVVAGGAVRETRVNGGAGGIRFSAAETLLLQGALSGQAAADGAAGGALAISLDPGKRPAESADAGVLDERFPSGPRVFEFAGLEAGLADAVGEGMRARVEADLRAALAADNPGLDPQSLDSAVQDALPAQLDAAVQAALADMTTVEGAQPVPDLLNGYAFAPLDKLESAGFETLDVKVVVPGGSSNPDRLESTAVIRFPEDMALALGRRITLDAPVFSTDSARVALDAPTVALGSTEARFRLQGAVPLSVSSTSEQRGRIEIDPLPGEGLLRVDAGLLDLQGESILQGFGGQQAAAELISRGDIRLRGTRVTTGDFETTLQLLGSLRSAGDLVMQAQQIYPTTLSDFALRVEDFTADGHLPVGRIQVLGQPGQPGQPLSAGGRVVLDAATVAFGSDTDEGDEPAGVLRAPLGDITFRHSYLDTDGNEQFTPLESITLADGSLLSTSADGLTIPFGRTRFQQDLVFEFGDQTTVTRLFETPPEKRILLDADSIDIRGGAQFDISGGGDVRAFEFVPGPGGSRDVLQAAFEVDGKNVANPSFAVLPGLGSEYAPVDPLETGPAAEFQGLQVGDTLTLEEGVRGLPAGEYAILPARYAIFGGYLVTPVAGSTDLVAGLGQSRLDGTPILAGRLGVAGSNVVAGRSQGFAIESGNFVRQRSQYAEVSLNNFFAGSGARLPVDGGLLTLAARSNLNLEGALVQGARSGRGTQVDISAADLAVVTASGDGEGIQLLAGDLSALGADSLLIGGVRRQLDGEVQISPSADHLRIEPGVELDVPELLLVARALDIDSRPERPTTLASTAPVAGVAEPLSVEGDAAIVALSNRRGLSLQRLTVPANPVASLQLQQDASLLSSGSVLADSSASADIVGGIDVDGGTLALGANRISLGETDGKAGLSGLVLSNADLERLAGSDLSLRSAGAIDLFGALATANGEAHRFDRLSLDAAGLVGNDAGAGLFAADGIELANRAGATVSGTTGAGRGALQFETSNLTLGEGEFVVSGYDTVSIGARDYVLAEAGSGLKVEGGLLLETPLVTASAGVESSIQAVNRELVVRGGGQTRLPAEAGLGASLTLAGSTVSFSSQLIAPSGQVALLAATDVMLKDGALIDVSGRDVVFAGEPVGTPGGEIRIGSGQGDVSLDAGTTLTVSGAASGGEAGGITLEAPGGALNFSTQAVFSGTDRNAGSGAFAVDAATLASTGTGSTNVFDVLNQRLESGGFRARRDIRLRQDSIQLTEGQTLQAHKVRLTSDSGDVVVDGNIDASGVGGGRITLSAADSVAINGRLIARADSAEGDGGHIELVSQDVDGDDFFTHSQTVSINAGAELDVSGGSQGQAGTVNVRVQAYDSDADGINDALALGALSGTVKGAASADVEAVNRVVLSGGVIDRADIDAARVRLDQFMVQSGGPALPAGWRLRPGLEFYSQGDLLVDLSERTNITDVTEAGYSLIESPFAGITGLRDNLSGTQIGSVQTDPLSGQPVSIVDDANGNILVRFDPDSGAITEIRDRTSGEILSKVAPGKWDFSDWRYGAGGDVPGMLSLKANGDLRLNGVLTDGLEQGVFEIGVLNPFSGGLSSFSYDRLQTSDSWDFRLVGGADIRSADLLAVRPQAGNIGLSADSIVRTGSGDIDLSAGGDINLVDGAAVYTVGKNGGVGSLADIDVRLGSLVGISGSAKGEALLLLLLNKGQFGVDGGDIRLQSSGKLQVVNQSGTQGAISLPLSGEWQPRIGGDLSQNANISNMPLYQAVAADRFKNGIGALGGGDISARTEGGIENLLFALPSTIQPAAFDTGSVENTGALLAFPDVDAPRVAGGGSLEIDAGGNILGSYLHIDRGTADIRARGSIAASGAGLNTLVALGDAQASLQAGKDITLGKVFNPGVLPISSTQLGLLTGSPFNVGSILSNPGTVLADYGTFFYTYTDESLFQARALAGDITLLDLEASEGDSVVSRANALDQATYLAALGSDLDKLMVNPPGLRLVSFQGGIGIGQQKNNSTVAVKLFPGRRSTVELLADQDIVADDIVFIQSDVDPALLAGAGLPDQDPQVAGLLIGGDLPSVEGFHAAEPVHLGDRKPNLIVSRSGSITSTGSNTTTAWRWSLAKQSRFFAAVDISNVTVEVQHNGNDDISLFQANRSIVQAVKRSSENEIVADDGRVFEIAGPGRAEFIAGDSIELGTGDGIRTIGDLANPALTPISTRGADVVLQAGVQGEPDYATFLDSRIINGPDLDGPVTGSFHLLFGSGQQVTAENAATLIEQVNGIRDAEVVAGSTEVGDRGLSVDIRLDSEAAVGELVSNDVLRLETGDLVKLGLYRNAVQNDMRQRNGAALPVADSLAAFSSLDGLQQSALLRGVFFNELRNSGIEGNASGDFSAGFASVKTLFPRVNAESRVSTLFSQVQTRDGGGIDVLVPGGRVDAGLAQAGFGKSPDELGIVALTGGDINGLVDGDFLVNSSRVFALRGDLLVWSSNGSIDAGKGAKTVVSVPDPIITFDDNGNSIVTFPPSVSGSGLQGVNGFLFAPRGIINAGDAGIAVSGNLTVAANQVLGADNIDVGGSSVGVPTGEAVAVDAGVIGAGDVASSAARLADDSMNNNLQGDEESQANSPLGILSVEILGFGEQPANDKRETRIR